MIEIFKSKGCFEDDFWVFFSLRSRSLAGADLFLCTEPAFLCNAMGQKHGDPAIHCTGRCWVPRTEAEPFQIGRWWGTSRIPWRRALEIGGKFARGGAGRYNNDSICEPKIQNHKILLYQFHRPYFLLIQDEGRSTIWKKKSTKSKKFQKTFRS